MRKAVDMFGWGLDKPFKFEKVEKLEDSDPVPGDEEWSDPLVGHRIDRFSDLGFGLFESLALALDKEVAWTDAKHLLDEGASHEQALAILR